MEYVTKPFVTQHPFTTDKDISSSAFWRRSFEEREETFAWLRSHAPVSWHPSIENQYLPAEVPRRAGFWAVTRAKDIQFVSQNHEIFSSAVEGADLLQHNPSEVLPPSFLEMDPPEQTRYRKIMSAAFTPRGIRRIAEQIDERAHQIVASVVGAGEIDFVQAVSARLPMLTIADLVGVPESLVETFARAGDGVMSGMDDAMRPDGVGYNEFVATQLGILRDIGVEIVDFRRREPGDDIATALAEANFDGKPLTDDEIASVMLLLSVAGNDTTKQTTSLSLLELQRNPDQRAWLEEDFDGRIMTAIEEFVRHGSPVMTFARTATCDFQLGGQRISEGDRVGVFYCSGNRDDELFEDPRRFWLDRPRKQHLGFGGGGVHFCLGNGVAKAQLRAMFREILTQLPDYEVVGEPEYMFSEFIHGITRLPVQTN
ncbi:putative cytochrome P450 [metagenome]|uniref:Putative cytochrome P450 n=1 Tax=metagenome TaxID=256318 RepID=A0A2P2C422_9ZZZZ